MSYIVYILANDAGVRYTGYTSDLAKRLRYHNSGLSHWTKNRGPWKLIYTETYGTKSEALRREKFLKSGKGREFLDKI